MEQNSQNNAEKRQVLYKTQGTCSQYIEVSLDENGCIDHCQFYGGCNGNTQGVAKLVLGQRPEDVIQRLNGIHCGARATSCPDQLCRALEQLQA